MASINSRSGFLFLDFRYRGIRCREYTKLPDTPVNRKRLEKLVVIIRAEIADGRFNYESHFPGSKMAARVSTTSAAAAISSCQRPLHSAQHAATTSFTSYTEQWFSLTKVTWRDSHIATIRSTLDRHLIPYFGAKDLTQITKTDVLEFRSQLATLKGRGKNAQLSAKTINRILQILSQIMDEAAEQYGTVNPVNNVKRLRQQRVYIKPFSLEEVRQLIASIREDYRDYLVVRFFTGMRTGEIHGLKHKYLDFERRQILVRETVVRGKVTHTKTDGSQREIQMSQPVFEALQRQAQLTRGKSEFVFCTRNGLPFDVDDVTNRIWYPLLRFLGIEERRPYQTRHTAATLWLGAGENPEWVARQLGHASTEMLFKTYSRYVPNLTRRDGSAINNLLTSALNGGTTSTEKSHG